MLMLRGVLIVAVLAHAWCSLACGGAASASRDAVACPVCPARPVTRCCEVACCCEESDSTPPQPPPPHRRPVPCCITAGEPLGLPPKAQRLAPPLVIDLFDAAAFARPCPALAQSADHPAMPWLTRHGVERTLALLCVWNN